MSYVADLRILLQGRDFRRLFGTRLTSQLADGWFQVALAGLFFFSPERATTAHGVAGAFAVLLLPYSLLGPFVGVLLDRWRRRQVLVRSNLLRAGMVLGVAAIIVAELRDLVLAVAVLATLAVNRFYLAALSAGLPHVVSREELVLANAVTPTSGTLAFVTGLGTGVVARAVLGDDTRVLLLASVGYLASAWIAARMHPDRLGPHGGLERVALRVAAGQVVSGLIEGARHVWATRPARNALGAMTTMRFAYGLSAIAVVLLMRNYFNDPGRPDDGLADLALVFLASGLGFFAAALLTPGATRVLGMRRWMVVCLGAAGLVNATLVPWLERGWVISISLLVGLAAQGVKICVDTIVQETIDDGFRGRVFSFYDVLFNVAFVSAAAIAALVVPSDGSARWLYGAIGGVYAAAALAYAAVTPRPTPLP
ncbi:MAG TPA: MFS transporter [Actinomycetes bacterium]|nr:MFS transporter [Actinomycetes bacterium]